VTTQSERTFVVWVKRTGTGKGHPNKKTAPQTKKSFRRLRRRKQGATLRRGEWKNRGGSFGGGGDSAGRWWTERGGKGGGKREHHPSRTGVIKVNGEHRTWEGPFRRGNFRRRLSPTTGGDIPKPLRLKGLAKTGRYAAGSCKGSKIDKAPNRGGQWLMENAAANQNPPEKLEKWRSVPSDRRRSNPTMGILKSKGRV